MIVASDIVKQLRLDIVNQEFGLNGKLPTREEFSWQYGASKATVQKALAELEAEGFIISRGTLGTFVNPNSPNHTDIALLLPVREEQLTVRDELFNLVNQEHHNLEKHTGKNLRYFYIDREQRIQDDFEKVAEEANRTRLSGVILPFPPQSWMLEPFIRNNIPVVVLTDENISGVSTVWVDYSDFFKKALHYCRRQNCRRPALLANFTLPYHHIEDYFRLGKEAGFKLESRLVQGQSEVFGLPWLRHNLDSFFHGPEPADAIIICDEAFLPDTIKYLFEHDRIPGKDIQLICERTFPHCTCTGFPVKFIGFDLYEIIDTCLRALEALRAGGKPMKDFALIAAIES